MATYVFGTFALGSFLVIVLWIVGNALYQYWHSFPSEEATDHPVPERPRPMVPPRPVQPRVELKTADPTENKPQIEIHKSPAKNPSVASPPVRRPSGTRQSETDVEEIMEAAERLLGLTGVSNDEKEALTTHQRAYYAHYYAAKFQLSQGNINGFRRELKQAGHELADMEEILLNYRPGLQNQVLGHSFA